MQSTFEDQIPSEPIHPGPGPNMCENNNTQSIADYLAQLLKDKKQLAAFPNVFLHLERLLDDGKHLPRIYCIFMRIRNVMLVNPIKILICF